MFGEIKKKKKKKKKKRKIKTEFQRDVWTGRTRLVSWADTILYRLVKLHGSSLLLFVYCYVFCLFFFGVCFNS